jgi:WD40 repeat protein
VHLPRRTILQELVGDAARFVQTFASSIEEHPLLVYLSALPFTPIDTLLYKTFTNCDRDIPRIVGGYNSSWPPLLQVFSGYEVAMSIAISQDGMQIVSSHRDGVIRIWDALSGSQIFELLPENVDDVYSVAVSPDGRWVVSGSDDMTVRLWDTNSGDQALPPMRGHTDAVYSVAFSPNSTRIASGSADNTVCLWDVTSGRQVLPPLQGHTNSVSAVKFNPEGTRIISGSYDKTIRVWDSMDGRAIVQPFQGHNNAILSIAISPNGETIASCSSDQTICMWVAETGVHRLCLQLSQMQYCHPTEVVFFPDSTHIASMWADNRVRLWDAISGALLSTSSEHKNSFCMTISPSGEQLAIGYDDATIGLWNTIFMSAEDPPHMHNWIQCTPLTFSPNGNQIAFVTEDVVTIWDAHCGGNVLAQLRGHECGISTIAFSPDGKLIASGTSRAIIRVWDTISWTETLSPFRGHQEGICSLAFSPDGSQIVSGGHNSIVCLWDSTHGHQVSVLHGACRGHTLSVSFSPDGRRVLHATSFGEVQVWDHTSDPITSFRLFSAGEGLDSIRFSPDGLYIEGDCGGFVQIWDNSGARVVKRRQLLHHTCAIDNPIIVTHDSWVVHAATQTVIGKLPSIVSMTGYAASQTSIVFTTRDRRSMVFQMDFPPTELVSPGTCNFDTYMDDEESDEDCDGDHQDSGGESSEMSYNGYIDSDMDEEEEDRDYYD